MLFGCGLLSVLLVAGCGSSRDTGSPYGALQTPGPPPAARPGSHVWAVGMPLLVVASANGGATWQTSHRTTTGDPFTQVLYRVAFGDAGHGWAVGKAAVIVATSDGGSSWAVQHEKTMDVCLLGVAATDALHAWAVGYTDARRRGLVLATVDGGATWQRQYAGSDALNAVAFGDVRHGWAVGSTGILATSDGGAHWRLQRAVSDLNLYMVACSGVRHCWAVGGAGSGMIKPGFVMATSDGGAHWATQLSATKDRLNGVSFVDARHGWIAGAAGVLYRTNDGGASWTLIQLDRSLELGAVSFSDREHGWMIVHPTWRPDLALSSNAKRGWGLLHQLALLATSDGGSTWTVVQSAEGIAAPVILTDVASRDSAGSH
jgi:photosystem II stability/assembly factor-like uncharacterized protein